MKAQDDTKEIAHIILHAVDSVQYGKHKLACFLKGSCSKGMIPLMQENVFGGLFWCNISVIEGFIEQLEAMDLIERIEKQGFPYPFSVYALSDGGRKAIDEKISIPLQVIKKEKPVIVGDSEHQTLKLLKEGKPASEIARIRNLAESTIYSHFYRLITNGLLSSSDIIPENIEKSIKEACSNFDKRPSLKEIKEQLPEETTYDYIRCVTADYYGKGE
jgi:hypothetical protein